MNGTEPPGEHVEGTDRVYRRFDPSNPNHFRTDERSNELRMRSGALAFDDELPDGHLGCSVYLASVLAAHGLDYADCAEARHRGVAAITAAEVRSEMRPGQRPFDVRKDPLELTVPGWTPRDLAHAPITHPRSASRRDHSRWYSSLARKFTVLIPVPGQAN